MQAERFESWAILELMGHVRMAGRVTEEERFGAKMGRIDVPGAEGGYTTVYFGGGSVYRMTPTTEAIARAVATHNAPEPVHRWELPRPEAAAEVLDGTGAGRVLDPEDDESEEEEPEDMGPTGFGKDHDRWR
jgi:hypothetical protein